MRTPRIAAAASAILLFLPALVVSAVSQRIPVVTQVQGAVFYRTFLMIGVASGSPAVTPRMTLTYRSPVDGTVQTPTLTLAGPIAGGQATTFEDVIQTFKDSGLVRDQDLSVGLFGTLEVVADALTDPSQLSVVARTFSPANGGGTNGIAYVGRDPQTAGSTSRIVTFVRNGTFGARRDHPGQRRLRQRGCDAGRFPGHVPGRGERREDQGLHPVERLRPSPRSRRGRAAQQRLRWLGRTCGDAPHEHHGVADHRRPDLGICGPARLGHERRIVLPHDGGAGAVRQWPRRVGASARRRLGRSAARGK